MLNVAPQKERIPDHTAAHLLDRGGLGRPVARRTAALATGWPFQVFVSDNAPEFTAIEEETIAHLEQRSPAATRKIARTSQKCTASARLSTTST